MKNLYRKRNNSAGCRFAKNPFAWFFRKRSTGTAILETVLTLPIVLYVLFFSLELVRLGLAQLAVDAITKEFTFYLMAKGKVVKSEVDAIFNKYRPWGIPIGRFRYNIFMYANMETLMGTAPYGGSSICWTGEDYDNPNPTMSPTQRALTAYYGRGATGNQVFLSKYRGSIGSSVNPRTLLEGDTSSSGYIFVLTVVVNFPFSSPFVKKLFNGGSNTVKVDGSRADAYILWARGSGMIN